MSIRFSLLLPLLFVQAVAATPPIQVANGDWAGLVAALEQSNQSGTEVQVWLAPRGMYLRRNAAQPALPEVRGRVVLIGNDAQLRTDAEDGIALLRVARSGQIQISELVLAGADGAALINQGQAALWRVRIEDNFNVRGGGAVENHGHLSFDDSLIGFNTAHGSDAVAGIANFGRLTLVDSRLVDNQVYADRSSTRAVAALLNLGHARLLRVRLQGNEADAPLSVVSGVLANAPGAVLEVSDTLLNSERTQPVAALPGDAAVAWSESGPIAE